MIKSNIAIAGSLAHHSRQLSCVAEWMLYQFFFLLFGGCSSV